MRKTEGTKVNKTNVLILPVIDENEATTSGMIKILREINKLSSEKDLLIGGDQLTCKNIRGN